MRHPLPRTAPEPDPRYPNVECGDTLVFQHPQRGPTALKILAQGRHGVTGVCPLGDRFRVRWKHILGHKERVQRRFEVVEHGEDGVIVRDQDGVRRWLHNAPSETNDRSDETKAPSMTKSQPSTAQIEAGNYPKKHLRFQGLAISIENPKGSTRSGTDRGGKVWTTTMRHDYGYVRGTCGVDKDHVDCYIGPDPEATAAYIVHQRKAGQWDQYDEDKVMLGFPNQAAATAAYLQHYNDPRFLGPVTAMPMDEFKRKALATAAKPAMIKGKILFLKSMVRGHIRRLASGKTVTVQPYQDKRTKKGDPAASGDLFADQSPETTPKPRRDIDDHSTRPRRVSNEPAPTPPPPDKEPEPTPPKPAPKPASNPFLTQTIAQTLQGKAASYWLGELVRDDDVCLDTKVMRWPATTHADFGLAIYENGKKTWSAPFPGLTRDTTNQQAARVLVDYLKANGKDNQRLHLRLEKIGERHASDQAQQATREAGKARREADKTARAEQRELKDMRQFRKDLGGSGNPQPWDAADLAEYQKYQTASAGRFHSAADDLVARIARARIWADPTRWKVGDGVGWRVARQINRGYQIVDLDLATKTATVRMVRDTGLTTSGGDHDRMDDQVVHVADLVHERKNDAPQPKKPARDYSQQAIVKGYRGVMPEGSPGFGASEGNGVYIAKNQDLAAFFSSGDKTQTVRYRKPIHPLKVHEEPLPILLFTRPDRQQGQAA